MNWPVLISQFLNVAMEAMKAVKTIQDAQAEGRELTKTELAELDVRRHRLEENWKSALKELENKQNEEN